MSYCIPRIIAFLAGLTWLVLAPSVKAASEPSWYRYTWDIPIIKGEYMPVNGGTLGSLGVSFTDDARHIFGVSTVYFDEHGVPQTDATGGVAVISDDETVRDTGIIASAPITYFRMSDGPCRGCGDHPRKQVATNDVGKFEWTGPRSGRYTWNGMTQDMVEATSGPPAVAATDFSGRWIMSIRIDLEYPDDPGVRHHFDTLMYVDLKAVNEDRIFKVEPVEVPGVPPQAYGAVVAPPRGAHLYDVTCVTPSEITPCMLSVYGPGAFMRYDLPYSNEHSIWFDDTNVGHLFAAKNDQAVHTIYDFGHETPRVYGVNDKIVGRELVPKTSGYNYRISEFAMFRTNADASSLGSWMPK